MFLGIKAQFVSITSAPSLKFRRVVCGRTIWGLRPRRGNGLQVFHLSLSLKLGTSLYQKIKYKEAPGFPFLVFFSYPWTYSSALTMNIKFKCTVVSFIFKYFEGKRRNFDLICNYLVTDHLSNSVRYGLWDPVSKSSEESPDVSLNFWVSRGTKSFLGSIFTLWKNN